MNHRVYVRSNNSTRRVEQLVILLRKNQVALCTREISSLYLFQTKVKAVVNVRPQIQTFVELPQRARYNII